MTLILGIDPGSRKTGYGLVEQTQGKQRFVACGTLDVTAAGEMPQRLGAIFRQLNALCDQYQPHEVAIEKVFMARNADSALKLGQARGAAIAAVSQHELALFEYSARQVKQTLTGQGGATKPQVAQMVCRLLQLDTTPQEDAADALAIAISHAHLRTSLLRLSQANGMRAGRLTSTAAKTSTQSQVRYPR